MMKHQDTPAQAIGTHLETGAVGGEGVLANRPFALTIPYINSDGLALIVRRQTTLTIVLSIVKDHFEHPIIVAVLRKIIATLMRRLVAVLDALKVVLRRAAPVRFRWWLERSMPSAFSALY